MSCYTHQTNGICQICLQQFSQQIKPKEEKMEEHETFFSHKCFDGIWRNELSRNCLFCEKRKPIKPKEEKMQEPMIPVTYETITWFYAAHQISGASVTLSEAERLGEEAKRIRAEIAKRDEIGPGDWIIFEGRSILKCEEVAYGFINVAGAKFAEDRFRKLYPTPEAKAWLDSVIK